MDSMEVTEFAAPMGDTSALRRFCKESKRHNMVTKDFSRECVLTILAEIFGKVGTYPSFEFLLKLKTVVENHLKIMKDNKDLWHVVNQQPNKDSLVKALQEQKLEWIVRISDETCEIVTSKDPLVKITYLNCGKIMNSELSGLRMFSPNYRLPQLIFWKALK